MAPAGLTRVGVVVGVGRIVRRGLAVRAGGLRGGQLLIVVVRLARVGHVWTKHSRRQGQGGGRAREW